MVAAELKTIASFAAGKPTASQSKRTGIVWNPATGEPRAHVEFASAAEVDAIVASALAAFPQWRATPLSRRAEIMFHSHELVHANKRHLAELITLEHGKTLPDASAKSRAASKTSNSPAASPTS